MNDDLSSILGIRVIESTAIPYGTILFYANPPTIINGKSNTPIYDQLQAERKNNG